MPFTAQGLAKLRPTLGRNKSSRLNPAWCDQSFLPHGPSMPLRHHRQRVTGIALNLIGQSTVPSIDSSSHQRRNPLCNAWSTTRRITQQFIIERGMHRVIGMHCLVL
jgi:hypothetical protein